MSINATFIGQIIVFLILLWFINKFVVPPISAGDRRTVEEDRRGTRGRRARPEGPRRREVARSTA